MGNSLDGFTNSRVPENQTVGGLRLASINGVLAFGIPVLIVGAKIGFSIGLERAIKAFIAGGLILSVISFLIGLIGVRNRVSSYIINKFVFGRRASIALNLSLAISVLCWYGVSMDIFSATLKHLCTSLFELSPSIWQIEVVAGFLMTFTAIWGFSLLQRISLFIVPLMIAVICYMAWIAYGVWDLEAVIGFTGQGDMSDGEAITAVTGTFIVSAVLMSDFARFAKKDSDVITASFLPFFMCATLGYIVAAVVAVLLHSSDLLKNMLALGLGSGALFLIFLSAWIANVINLYSCSLNMASVFVRFKQWHLVIMSGVVGTFAALANILDGILNFLIVASVFFVPIGGIFVVDFFIIRKRVVYPLSNINEIALFKPKALIAWGGGVGLAAFLNQFAYLFTGVAVLDAFLISAIIYWLLSLPKTFYLIPLKLEK